MDSAQRLCLRRYEESKLRPSGNTEQFRECVLVLEGSIEELGVLLGPLRAGALRSRGTRARQYQAAFSARVQGRGEAEFRHGDGS